MFLGLRKDIDDIESSESPEDIDMSAIECHWEWPELEEVRRQREASKPRNTADGEDDDNGGPLVLDSLEQTHVREFLTEAQDNTGIYNLIEQFVEYVARLNVTCVKDPSVATIFFWLERILENSLSGWREGRSLVHHTALSPVARLFLAELHLDAHRTTSHMFHLDFCEKHVNTLKFEQTRHSKLDGQHQVRIAWLSGHMLRRKHDTVLAQRMFEECSKLFCAWREASPDTHCIIELPNSRHDKIITQQTLDIQVQRLTEANYVRGARSVFRQALKL